MGLRSFLKRHDSLYRAALAARTLVYGGYMKACRAARGVNPRKIVFSSYKGTAYSEGPRAVSEALHALSPDAEIVWLLAEDAMGRGELPDYVRVVPPRTASALRELATAKVMVDNFNLPYYRSVSKDQYMIQLWHGDRPFKKIMFDAMPREGFIDGKVTSLAVAGSDFGERLFRSAFRYNGKILKVGTPRDDLLVNPPSGLAEQVRRTLGIPDGAKVALYAPTFRDSAASGEQSANLDLTRVTESLSKAWGGEWVCLSRGHDLVKTLSAPGAIDVSRYPEISHLLLASDCLITDYSSCAADFSLLGRPVYLYQADVREYTERDRALYFDPAESPFVRATDPESFYHLLETPFDSAANGRDIAAFFGTRETGRAAQAVAERIKQVISGGITE